MDIKEKGNFKNISINDAGTGVIVTKRINEEWAKKHAHMYADGYNPSGPGRVFRAKDSGCLTSENQRIIVQIPENN